MRDDGFPPSLDDARLSSDSLSSKWFWVEADVIERELRGHDPTDPAARSVVASMLWSLARPNYSDDHLIPERRQLFRRYVALAPPGAIDNLGQLRWEIHAAAAANDLERVIALGRLWEELEPDLAHISDVVRTIFLLIHPNFSIEGWWPSFWDSRLTARDGRMVHLADLTALLLAITVERPTAVTDRSRWSQPTNFDQQVLDAIHLCHFWLDRAERRTGVLAEVPALVRCWCDFALGLKDADLDRLQRAASGDIRLSKNGPFGDLPGASRAAVCCLLLANQFSKAEPVIRELVASPPLMMPISGGSSRCAL